jgi:hypothetical protein
MKMFWFFTSTTEIPWAFKLCGIFQAGCDIFLGIQYMMYGSGENPSRDYVQMSQWSAAKVLPKRISSGFNTPSGRRTPVNEKDI